VPDREYTPYQRKAIRNYYRNEAARKEQRLGEIVSEIWLATTPKRRDALWAKAHDLLLANGVPAAEADRITTARDVEALAKHVH
jgi:hypothetical protein